MPCAGAREKGLRDTPRGRLVYSRGMARNGWLLVVSALVACYDPTNTNESATADDSTGSSTDASTSATTATTATTTATTTSASTSASTTTTTADDSSSSADATADSSGSETADGSSSSSGGPLSLCDDPTVQHVYLDFDGATIVMGVIDNGPAYLSSDDSLVGEWDPYADDDIDEVVDFVRDHFAPYRICITTDVPTILDYTVVVVTTEAAAGSEQVVTFVHPYDCGNASLDDLEAVFLHPSLNLPPITKAIAISSALGHRLGLDPVDDPADLMNRYVGTTNNGATFTANCLPYAINGASLYCEGMNGPGCMPTEQSSDAYLLEVLGAAE